MDSKLNDQHQSTNTNGPYMRDFWPIYRRRTYIIITCTQSALVIAIFGILYVLGILSDNIVTLALAALFASTVLNAATITLVHIIGKPFRDLIQAIVLISGEPTRNTPPNPNQYENNKDGFKQIIQAVYSFSSKPKTPLKNNPIEDTPFANSMQNIAAGVVIMDSSRSIIYHNSQAPVRKNTKDEDVVELLLPEDDSLEKWHQDCLDNKVSSQHTWERIPNKLPGENERRIFDVIASYHKDSPAETVILFIDRTNQYMPEEDGLDFIAFAAHELRGPITVIRGYLDVLQDELGPVMKNDQKELMTRLQVASNRLTSYVNNILNAAKYDRSHLRLRLSEETVRHIYDSIADDMELRARSQNRLLVADIPENLPTVAADVAAISEVLGNLIDNAIKYSNEGGLVHLVARTIPGFVEISVIDRGIGMPVNVLPNLFHKFYRSHRSRETVAGTGIGLYISKAIVNSHGGIIDVRSVENEGSTFSFTLPIYDTVAAKLKTEDNSNQSLIEHGSGWIRNHSVYRG